MNVIIIHGTKGSPAINWFPWLAHELNARGHTAYVPHMPTPDNMTPAAWHAALAAQAPAIDADTILVGHSLGANFILHTLEQHATARSILVAPVIAAIDYKEYSDLNAPFTHHPFNWPRIRANAGRVTILHGDNDPYVPLAQAQTLHGHIGGDLRVIAGGQHLNGEAGYTELPVLLDLI